MYQPVEARNLPEGSYGAAAMMMVKEGIYPSWALFCYKELRDSSEGCHYMPQPLYYITDDAILLAPRPVDDNSFSGMLIAMESASDQIRVFTSNTGENIQLLVPYVNTKFVAVEDSILSTPMASLAEKFD